MGLFSSILKNIGASKLASGVFKGIKNIGGKAIKGIKSIGNKIFKGAKHKALRAYHGTKEAMAQGKKAVKFVRQNPSMSSADKKDLIKSAVIGGYRKGATKATGQMLASEIAPVRASIQSSQALKQGIGNIRANMQAAKDAARYASRGNVGVALGRAKDLVNQASSRGSRFIGNQARSLLQSNATNLAQLGRDALKQQARGALIRKGIGGALGAAGSVGAGYAGAKLAGKDKP